MVKTADVQRSSSANQHQTGSSFFSVGKTDAMPLSFLQNNEPFFNETSIVENKPFFLQRKCTTCEEDNHIQNKPEVQLMPAFESSDQFGGIQAKLSVGRPNDKYEQEADSNADQVVKAIAQSEGSSKDHSRKTAQPSTAPNIQAKCSSCEQEELQTKEEANKDVNLAQLPIGEFPSENSPESPNLSISPIIQKSHESAEQDDLTPLQNKAQSENGNSTAISESALQSSKGRGNPLPEETRGQMEGAFGADFSKVRIHTGGDAIQMSKGLGAQAFTHRNDIYFNESKFQPNTKKGQHLLAHELTHTLQQSNQPSIQTALCDDSQPSPNPPVVSPGPSPGPSGPSIPGLGPAINYVKRKIRALFRKIINLGRSLWRQLLPLFSMIRRLWTRIKPHIIRMAKQFLNFIKTRFSGLIHLICHHFCDIMPFIEMLGRLTVRLVQKLIQLKNWLIAQWTNLKLLFQVLKSLGRSLWNGITSKLRNARNTALNWIRNNLPGGSIIANLLSGIINIIMGWVRTIIDSIWAFIQRIWNLVLRCISYLFNKIKGGIRKIFNWLNSRYPGEMRSIKKVINDLRRVQWQNIFKTEGHNGDWGRLFFVWFCETSPSDLGTWANVGGVPTVTITPGNGYIQDLKNKPHHAEAKQKFVEALNNGTLDANNCNRHLFRFTGEGTATGNYDMIEWFLGSYQTNICLKHFDQASRQAVVEVKIYNRSHWQSGTRVPPSWIRRGFPPYLIPNMTRPQCGPGGTFDQNYIWTETIQLPRTNSGLPVGSSCTFVIEPARNGKVIRFDQDKANVSPASELIIATIARSWLAGNPGVVLRVDGYASEEGSDEYNYQLSCDRALKTKEALVAKGVPAENIEPFSHGETTEFGPALPPNRRAIVSNR